jgi:hypothetical protein
MTPDAITANKWSQPTPVSDVDVAFPANVLSLMPPMDEIPDEFKAHSGGYYNKLFEDWFYQGISKDRLPAREGIDHGLAVRHLRCVIGSFQPKHEHKAAAAAYLMSLWFELVTATTEATA